MACRKFRLKVEGMTCMKCAGVVVNAFASLPGVSNPQVSVEHEEVFIELDEERSTKEEVVAAIEKQGFDVTAFEPI